MAAFRKKVFTSQKGLCSTGGPPTRFAKWGPSPGEGSNLLKSRRPLMSRTPRAPAAEDEIDSTHERGTCVYVPYAVVEIMINIKAAACALQGFARFDR